MVAFVHPFVADKISEEQVVSNRAFPLVRELAHKYGMRVIATKPYARDESQAHTLAELYLGRDDGIIMCGVVFDIEKESFAFRNSLVRKERGRSDGDKLTYTGKKVNFLMKTIAQHNMLPSASEFFTKIHGRHIRNCVDALGGQFGDMRKTANLIDGEITHRLMEIVFGNQTLSSLSSESMDKVQSAVDKYRHIDKMRIERQREMYEVFDRPVWMVYYDSTGSFGVGKIKITPKWAGMYSDNLDGVHLELVEDFKRIKDPTEVGELIPTLAMLKTHLQQHRPDREFLGESGFFPKDYESVSPELRVMGYHAGDRWDRAVLGQPKFLIIPT
jgi:hypothetical protein